MSCAIPICAAWRSARSISPDSFITRSSRDKGFTIHKTGLPALQMFLNTRMYLYSNVYFHRTTRAIDIHLRDIFGDTMKLLFPHDPRKKMDDYLTLTDWSLLEQVRGMEDLSPCRRTAPGRRMAADSRPRRQMEDGLQHRAQGKGPRTRHGLSQPRALRRSRSKKNCRSGSKKSSSVSTWRRSTHGRTRKTSAAIPSMCMTPAPKPSRPTRLEEFLDLLPTRLGPIPHLYPRPRARRSPLARHRHRTQ